MLWALVDIGHAALSNPAADIFTIAHLGARRALSPRNSQNRSPLRPSWGKSVDEDASIGETGTRMKHYFVHVSDIHFRGDWPEQSDLVLKAFLADLEVQKAAYPGAYLIISGDLVQGGGIDGIYAKFKENFDSALANVGFPIERRICIPGNHDVSRVALQPKVTLQQGCLSKMSDEEIFNNHFQQLSANFFAPTFANYKAAEAAFAKFTSCQDSLGGTGWTLPDNLGVYCLNSAVCSYGGLKDVQGKDIVDKNLLHIETRTLYSWLAADRSTTRVLLMHHPVEWLSEWASAELNKIIAESFDVVVSGHVHRPAASYSTAGATGVVHSVSPALFTRKADALGYSFLKLSEDGVEVSYRAWSDARTFVKGTVFSGNDDGVKRFHVASHFGDPLHIPLATKLPHTKSVLEDEFDEARTGYSSAKKVWVERDLATSAETANARPGSLQSATDFCERLRSCVIRAPRQFGLTCLGRFIALHHARRDPSVGTIVMLDLATMKPNKDAISRHIRRRCAELQISQSDLAALILDNWQNDKACQIIHSELRSLFPDKPVILLHSIDDAAEVELAEQIEEVARLDRFYLWSLSRSRIRELVSEYTKDLSTLEETAVTKKVIEELDSLNLHRTPLNCLTLLKLLEQAFDDSPVNRTEMIGRVLHLLFTEYQEIPRYNTRPDLKDCEHALGYICEWLMTSKRSTFTKTEFTEKVSHYCHSHLVDLDAEILFSFILSKYLLVRKGTDFEFRFSYWIYYFAAHRMYHSAEFASFILSEGRYAAFPEIIEFYAGIDRKREDAVTRLTDDLRKMNNDFLDRTQIAASFEPWRDAEWVPSGPVVDELLKQVTDSATESTLPISIKDAIADKRYDPSKPYRQELAKYMAESSLRQMISTMRGAARALRNSDYVKPELKIALMEEVIGCWRHVCQIIAMLSPLLAEQGRAYFEGMNFWLDDSWDREKLSFEHVLWAIPFNIATWYQEDIFSKKMGTLFARFISSHPGSLEEALIIMVMIAQRSPGWDRAVDAFIDRSTKNSFYLHQTFSLLFSEFKTAITTEKVRQQLRRLAAKSIAKHSGAKNPNTKVIEARAKELDDAAGGSNARGD